MNVTSSSPASSLSPVDPETYNLLQSLVAKLEGIERFSKYAADGGNGADMFERLARENADSAEEILKELRKQLAA